MSKTVRFQVFCTMSDLRDWLVPFGRVDETAVLVFSWGSTKSKLVETCRGLPDDAFAIYLGDRKRAVAEIDHDSISPRSWGWVKVLVGRQLDVPDGRALFVTDMSAVEPVVDGFAGGALIRALRTRLRKSKSVSAGVVPIHANAPLYRDIHYSKAAKHLWDRGYTWRYDATAKSAFRPGGSG